MGDRSWNTRDTSSDADYRVDILARRNRVTVTLGDLHPGRQRPDAPGRRAGSRPRLLLPPRRRTHRPPHPRRPHQCLPVQGDRHLPASRPRRGGGAGVDLLRPTSRGGPTGRLPRLLPGRRRPAGGHCGPGGLGAVSVGRSAVTDDSSVTRMMEIFDVPEDVGQDDDDVPGRGRYRFVGTSDGGVRRVVDGSQLLAQAVVAASKVMPGHTVHSAHAVFTRAVDDVRPLWFEVDVTHRGRTFGGAVVSVGQGDRRCAAVSVLLGGTAPDVIRHTARHAGGRWPGRCAGGHHADGRPRAATRRRGRPERPRRGRTAGPRRMGALRHRSPTGPISPGP